MNLNILQTPGIRAIFNNLQTFLGGISLGDQTLTHFSYGDWTPVPADAVTAGNAGTAATALGKYVRIGPIVFAFFTLIDIDTTGLTSSNNFFVQGLPFVAANITNIFGISTPRLANVGFDGPVIAQVNPNQQAVQFIENVSGANFANLLVSDFTTGTADVSSIVIYSAEAF